MCGGKLRNLKRDQSYRLAPHHLNAAGNLGKKNEFSWGKSKVFREPSMLIGLISIVIKVKNLFNHGFVSVFYITKKPHKLLIL